MQTVAMLAFIVCDPVQYIMDIMKVHHIVHKSSTAF